MWRIWNPGRVESHTAGIAKVTMRVALLITDGMVFPSAWNIDEHVKITPVAMKFHEMTCRKPAAIDITAVSLVKKPHHPLRLELADDEEHRHEARGRSSRPW